MPSKYLKVNIPKMNSNDKDYPVKTFSNGVKGLVSTRS